MDIAGLLNPQVFAMGIALLLLQFMFSRQSKSMEDMKVAIQDMGDTMKNCIEQLTKRLDVNTKMCLLLLSDRAKEAVKTEKGLEENNAAKSVE